MILYPAIDLYAGQAVRLEKGDYSRMTVYDCDGRVVRADFFCADAVPGHPRNGVIEPEIPIEQIDGMLKKMGMN